MFFSGNVADFFTPSRFCITIVENILGNLQKSLIRPYGFCIKERNMKKLIAVLILGLSLAVAVCAQDSSNRMTEYKLKNALVGFGYGSRLQGDMESARWLLASDITGLSLMTVGGVGLGLTGMVYEYMQAYYGDVSKADFWINGSVLGLGAVIFITGRLFGIILPEKFVVTENADLSLDSCDGNVAVAFKLRF